MVKLESQGQRSPLDAWKEMGENKEGMVGVCSQSNKKSALCWLNVGGEVGGVGVQRSLIPSTKWSVHGRPVEALTPTTSICILSIIVP
jgi:hypothetical protein